MFSFGLLHHHFFDLRKQILLRGKKKEKRILSKMEDKGLFLPVSLSFQQKTTATACVYN